MEMNFGDWEMKNWDDIPLEELNPWMQDFVNVRVSNGESFTDLYGEWLILWKMNFKKKLPSLWLSSLMPV